MSFLGLVEEHLISLTEMTAPWSPRLPLHRAGFDRFSLDRWVILEPLPRGELTRRAQKIAARHYDTSPLLNARPFRLISASGRHGTVPLVQIT
jgi:hypothetical protein